MMAQRRDHGLHYFDRPIGLLLVIAYKLIWGSMELVSGFLLMNSVRLLADELSEDPGDLFANWILTHIHLTQQDTLLLGLLLAGFGLIKIILGICLWFRLPFIRNLGLAFFSLVGLYGMYHVLFHYSPITLVALVADVSAFGYFWKILPLHLTRKHLYE